MNVVYFDVFGAVREESDCDECGAMFSTGVMRIIGETLDEVSGKMVPECKLFCSRECSDLWGRKHEW